MRIVCGVGVVYRHSISSTYSILFCAVPRVTKFQITREEEVLGVQSLSGLNLSKKLWKVQEEDNGNVKESTGMVKPLYTDFLFETQITS